LRGIIYSDKLSCTNIGHKYYLRSCNLGDNVYARNYCTFSEKARGCLHIAKKVAQVHAEAVVKYLEKLPLPKEQKLALLTALKKELQKPN
jgi:hypothetical protein